MVHIFSKQISVTSRYANSVQNAINKLKVGLLCGIYGLGAEHFKHADPCVAVLLSKMYSSALTNGHLPDDFMKTVIIALYENGYYTKCGDTSAVNSYTTIALVTVASKIFEIIWLDLWNLT